MAINKKKTPPIIKAGIILIAVVLVAAFTVPFISPGTFSSQGTGGSTAEGQLDAIAANYAGSIAAFEGQLASEPTSYTPLVNMGNTYFDWALDVQQAQQGAGAADRPLWISATVYYERALAQQPGDPAVTTDLAIAYYYSGDTLKAIETVEPAMENNPEFASAFFNAGIFYRDAGRLEEAAGAMTRYLELDPQGQFGSVDLANEIIGGGAATP